MFASTISYWALCLSVCLLYRATVLLHQTCTPNLPNNPLRLKAPEAHYNECSKSHVNWCYFSTFLTWNFRKSCILQVDNQGIFSNILLPKFKSYTLYIQQVMQSLHMPTVWQSLPQRSTVAIQGQALYSWSILKL